MRIDIQNIALKVTRAVLSNAVHNMGADEPEPAPANRLSREQAHNSPLPVFSPKTVDPKLDLPTTAETVVELKRRLGKELYRVELDLQNGGRIAGKPCDCLSKAKHSAGIEATAEELMSYESNPIYGEVINWVNGHADEFEPAEIAKRPPEYYQGLTPEIRNFRKKVMGTENVLALTRDGK